MWTQGNLQHVEPSSSAISPPSHASHASPTRQFQKLSNYRIPKDSPGRNDRSVVCADFHLKASVFRRVQRSAQSATPLAWRSVEEVSKWCKEHGCSIVSLPLFADPFLVLSPTLFPTLVLLTIVSTSQQTTTHIFSHSFSTSIPQLFQWSSIYL